MKKILLTLAIALGLAPTTKAQVITCIPCDLINMSVNIGSDTTSLNIHHAGQYLTHPQEFNVFAWEFTDQQGNIIFKDTIVDDAIVSFSHNFPITDTMNVTVYLRNDSANLDNWYISEGLPTNGNSINCLFEDQIYWMTGTYPSGTAWGRWEFISGDDFSNPGVDLNITLDSTWHCDQSAGCQWAGSNPSFPVQYASLSDCQAACNLTSINTLVNTEKKILIKVIDILGIESAKSKNQPLFYIYDDGTVEKRIILE